MDRRSEDETIEETPLDDAIGSTAYSQSYMASILKKLLNISCTPDLESWRDFVSEQDMCTLWDMTAEKDVANLLIDIGALELFGVIIAKSEDHRLLEIIIGIIANMSCEVDITLKIKTFPNIVKTVFLHFNSPDSLTLLQVLRFTSSVMYNDASDLKTWLEHLKDCNFNDSIRFILKNSSNKDVLMESLETLCKICTLWDRKDALLLELLGNKKFFKSLIVAFDEISKIIKKGKAESIDEERCSISFLCIVSTLSVSQNFSSLFDENSTEKLWINMNEILHGTLKIDSRSIFEVVESINIISSAFKYPMTNESIETCKILIPVWKMINQNGEIKNEESSQKTSCEPSDSELDFDLALANYFAKIIKSWPPETISELFGNIEKKFLTILVSNIQKLIELDKLDSQYDNVCLLLKSLLEK